MKYQILITTIVFGVDNGAIGVTTSVAAFAEKKHAQIAAAQVQRTNKHFGGTREMYATRLWEPEEQGG